MVYIAQHLRSSMEVALTGAALLACEVTTPRWTVCPINLSLSTPVTDEKYTRRTVAAYDGVWMENDRQMPVFGERPGLSGRTLPVHDPAANNVQRPGLSSGSDTTTADPAAKRPGLSGFNTPVHDPAANDDKRPGLSGGRHMTTADPAARERDGGRNDGHCNEILRGGITSDGWGTSPAALSARTLFTIDEVVEADLAPCPAAGVDTGPGNMEGALLAGFDPIGTKGQGPMRMADWNDLLSSEDQLGPLPVFGSKKDNNWLPEIIPGISLAMEINFELGCREFGNTVHTSAHTLRNMQHVRVETTPRKSKTAVLFCGAAGVHDEKNTGTEKHREKKHAAKRHGPRSFTRDPSEIPEGGYFSQIAATEELNPEPEGEEEVQPENPEVGTENFEASDSEPEIWHGLRIKKPFIFNGRADLDIFDQWIYEVDTWQELNGLSDEMMVKIVVNFMSGKASRFFMKHVAMRQKAWTPKLIYEALFDYCFRVPPDFKLRLRDELSSAKQGKNDVRDFLRDIETLAVRFPDVTERQLKQIFWQGIRTYLRMHLIDKGLDPERSPLEILVKHASRREAVKKAWKREKQIAMLKHAAMSSRRNRHQESDEWEHQSEDESEHDEQSDEPSDESENDDQSDDEPLQSDSENEVASTSSVSQGNGNGQIPRSSHPLLPQAEFERLRREGRCFKCRARGHLSRDCRAEEVIIETKSARFADSQDDDSDQEDQDDEESDNDDEDQSDEHEYPMRRDMFYDWESSEEDEFEDGHGESSDEY